MSKPSRASTTTRPQSPATIGCTTSVSASRLGSPGPTTWSWVAASRNLSSWRAVTYGRPALASR
ncbi:MAG: hypothetical protein ACYC8T_07125 [Myxococcaceae bacterium]